jgi:hypothetical protein
MDEQEVIIEMLQESKGLGWREAEDKAKDMSFSDLSKEDFKSCIVEMVKCHTEGSSVTMDYWSDDLTRFNDDKEHFDKHLAQILEMKEEFRSEFIKDYSTVAMLTGGVHLGKEFNGFCKIELD